MKALRHHDVYVFDLDGVLSDDSWRRHLMQPDTMEAYHSMAHGDEPIYEMAELVLNLYHSATVIISTGRPESHRVATVNWLRSKGIPCDELWMRTDGSRTADMKVNALSAFCKEHPMARVAMVYDDSPLVIAAMDDAGFNVTLYEPARPIKLSATTPAPEEVDGVTQALKAAAETFSERNKVYGSGYKRHGDIMKALFPNGFELHSANDFTRFHLLELMVIKLNRYCNNLQTTGQLHRDSIHDLGVYAFMLEDLL